jgi:hypothetical protein
VLIAPAFFLQGASAMMLRNLLGCLLMTGVVLVSGCGPKDQAPHDKPSPVTGTINGPDGKPMANVGIYFQPTGNGFPMTFFAENGTFKGDMIPGKYAWSIRIPESGLNAAQQKAAATAYKGVPEKFREGSMDRQIEVKPNDTITIDLK